MSTSSVRQQHAEWLAALDGDGPFLTVPALTQGLNQGLIPTSPDQNKALRQAHTQYTTAAPATTSAAYTDWVQFILGDLLGWGDHVDTNTGRYAYTDPIQNITITPTHALQPTAATNITDDTTPVMLVFALPPGTSATRRVGDGWATTPIDRAVHALRAANIAVGIVTDGTWWALLWAARQKTPGYALWSNDLLLDDDLLRSAFTTLLSRHRALSVADKQSLLGLFATSEESQEDITDNLSTQTRKAVELLVDAFSSADQRARGAYLTGIDPDDIYQGAVTVVMRLIFTLAAEETTLLPGADAFYRNAYSTAALADRLIERANLAGGDNHLATTHTAFPQLLATTRLIHDGSHHPRLNIAGYGGSVFDPTRYPWLEHAPSNPNLGSIAVDDRTMLHILRGLTRWDGRRLSYRTLDVEQIGYAYEGLLDHTAVLATTPVLGILGKKEPEISIDDLETAAERGDAYLTKWLKDLTGETPAKISKLLTQCGTPITDAAIRQRLDAACAMDTAAANRIEYWLPLLRTDARTGLPVVINPGTVYVTASSARGDTGTHYTPKSLAEQVVITTLDALTYSPGPLQDNDKTHWKLVAAQAILDLKVADIAMGSGAFLVATIRYLADRLLETLDTTTRHTLTNPELVDLWDLTHRDLDHPNWDHQRDNETLLAAKRLIAAHCIYGVDINTMAVEMAKLSIWLVTASTNQPFGFLDHRLQAGDSLLGLHNIRQLENLHIDATRGAAAYGKDDGKLLDYTTHVRTAITRVTELHRQIDKKRVVDTHDIDEQAALLADANKIGADLNLIADGLVGASLAAGKDRGKLLDAKTGIIQNDAEILLSTPTTEPDHEAARKRIRDQAAEWLVLDLPAGSFERAPIHWPLSFPEVFRGSGTGYSAVVGNPPFLGGKKISGASGVAYREHLVVDEGRGVKGNADLIAYMTLQAARLVDLERGEVGVIGTNTISQGDTREVGLDQICSDGFTIRNAVKSTKWPSKSASLEYALVTLSRQGLRPGVAPILGNSVLMTKGTPGSITPGLDPAGRSTGNPLRLAANRGISFIGSYVLGMGFLLEYEEARALISRDAKNSDVLLPYLNGQDLNSSPEGVAGRWAINFHDWPEDRARHYKECYARLEKLVKPERTRINAKGDFVLRRPLPQRWWIYADKRPALYSAIAELDKVIVITLVSNVVQPVRVPTGQVFASRLGVFATDSFGMFGLLCSSIHGEWVRKYATTLETRIIYGPTDVFETLPFPDDLSGLAEYGESVEQVRGNVQLRRRIGLTDAYNLLNDPDVLDPDVLLLRASHMSLDSAAVSAYGWSDIILTHGFFDTEQGIRFSLAPTCRDEILDRLLELNHQRHATEVAKGLVDASGRPTKVLNAGIRRTKSVHVVPQLDMFETADASE